MTGTNARFPNGARDAEGLFILPSGDLYILTKGRRGPIELFRYPSPERPGETVTLEHVRELDAVRQLFTEYARQVDAPCCFAGFEAELAQAAGCAPTCQESWPGGRR